MLVFIFLSRGATFKKNNKPQPIKIPASVPKRSDMGIFTPQGKIVSSMMHKYKQINRFLEMIEDTLKNETSDRTEPFRIIDFGCGKSYLTFIVYYYLTMIKKMNVEMIGLDLKKDVIEKCNQAAKKYQYHQLHFEVGNIQGYQTEHAIDMVVTLHACDTATDYALYHAIQWKAKRILSVPCCQHEWNANANFDQLAILSRYGIVQERISALFTDTVRANLLITQGYKTQILEFVSMEDTPKNLMIRAVRENVSLKEKEQALLEVNKLTDKFAVKPTLLSLLDALMDNRM